VKAALVHLDASDQIERVVDAIRATREDTDIEIAEMDEDEAMTRRALSLLDANRNDAYEAAIAELRDDTGKWWMRLVSGNPDEIDEGEEPYHAEASDLRRFLEEKVLAWFETRRKELANRPLIREQAFGEALDPGKLDRNACWLCCSASGSCAGRRIGRNPFRKKRVHRGEDRGGRATCRAWVCEGTNCRGRHGAFTPAASTWRPPIHSVSGPETKSGMRTNSSYHNCLASSSGIAAAILITSVRGGYAVAIGKPKSAAD
jgi:hypothetical protein